MLHPMGHFQSFCSLWPLKWLITCLWNFLLHKTSAGFSPVSLSMCSLCLFHVITLSLTYKGWVLQCSIFGLLSLTCAPMMISPRAPTTWRYLQICISSLKTFLLSTKTCVHITPVLKYSGKFRFKIPKTDLISLPSQTGSHCIASHSHLDQKPGSQSQQFPVLLPALRS